MDWITSGASKLDISDTLTALQILKDLYSKLKHTNEVDNGFDFIKWLLEQDTAANFKPQLTRLLESQQATDETSQLLEKLVDKIQKPLDGKYLPLFHRLDLLDLDNLPSDLEFPIIDVSDKSKDFAFGDLSVGLSGGMSASITFEGNAVEDPPVDSRVVSVTFKGSLQAKLAATLPINIGSLSATGGFSASGSYALLYVRPASELFIDALAEIFQNNVNPLSLQSMSENILSGNHFAKSTISLEGELAYGAKMKLGFKKNLSPAATFNAAIDIGLSSTIKGSFKLEVEPGKGQKINVSIRRNNSKTATSSLGIGVTIDASAVATAVKAKADEALAGPNKMFSRMIEKVDKFVTPSKYIQGKLAQISQELLADNDELLGAAQVALGIKTAEEATAALTENLLTQLDSRLLIWDGTAQNRANELITMIAEKLGVNEDKLSQFNTSIQSRLTELDSDFDSKIKEAIDSKITDWTNALGDIGIKVNAVTTSLDEKVAAVKAGVLKMINRYQQKLTDIVTKITDENKYKLEAKFTSEVKRQSHTDLMLKYEFDLSAVGADAETLQNYYQMLMRGKADKIFDAGLVAGVKLIDGVLTQTSLLNKSRGLHVSFFGLEFDNTSILEVNSKVIRNANGDIVAMSDATYTEQFKFGGFTQGAVFTDAFNIAMAKHTSLDLGFAASVKDTRLKPDELVDILDDLKKTQLITATTADEILRDYNHMRGDKPSVDTLLTTSLDYEQAQTEFLLGQRYSDDEISKQCFFAAFETESKTELAGSKENRLRKALENKVGHTSTIAEFMRGLPKHKLQIVQNKITDTDDDSYFTTARAIKIKADAFVKLVLCMREIYAVAADEALEADWLTEKQEVIGESVDHWVTALADLKNFLAPAISGQTLAFIQLLIRRSGWVTEEQLKLTINVKYKDKNFTYQ